MSCAVFGATNAPVPRPVSASATTMSSSGELASIDTNESTASASTTRPAVRGIRVPMWSEIVPASGDAIDLGDRLRREDQPGGRRG